jgi:hypothetical protein
LGFDDDGNLWNLRPTGAFVFHNTFYFQNTAMLGHFYVTGETSAAGTMFSSSASHSGNFTIKRKIFFQTIMPILIHIKYKL